MKLILTFTVLLSVAGLFLLGLSWALPHGCARTQYASEAIALLDQCDAVAELVGENLRPTFGYALGSYEQKGGEIRAAGSLPIRGDKASGKVSYRYHSRYGLDARLESQGEEISLATCGGAGAHQPVDAGARRLEGISNLSRVDLKKLQSSALEMARERWPDARISHIRSENVYPEGHADLTLGSGGHLTIIVGVSADQDDSLPKGVSGGQMPKCMVVSVNRYQQVVTEMEGPICIGLGQDDLPMSPKCDVRQIWARAVEAGAPSENAVATLSYIPAFKFWRFEIEEFSPNIPDDCT